MSIRPFQNQTPTLGDNVYIAESAEVIGEVTLGDDSSVWPMAVIRGDVNAISIGQRSNIQDASILHVTHKNEANPEGYPLCIGDDVTVGHKVMLHGCTIGNRVLIGMCAIVMDNVHIPDETIIGAGSLVPPGKKLESGHLYVGSPARKVRELTDAEKANLIYSAQHYSKLKDDYRN